MQVVPVAARRAPASSSPTRSADVARLAREILHGATAAALTVGGTDAVPVALGESTDGQPSLVLDAASPAVPALAACRVAVLRVPEPGARRCLRVTASFTMGRPDATGLRTYAATVLAVRLEPTDPAGSADPTSPAEPEVVPVADFLRAEPDADRAAQRSLLAHLDAAHGDDLVAAVRALGHDVEVVVPAPCSTTGGVVLDAFGLAGAVRVRLVAGPSGPTSSSDLTSDVPQAAVCVCPLT